MGATATVPVTLHNLSATPLTIAGGGVGSDVGLFGQGGSCSGATVPANGSCTLNYHFRPRTRSETVTASTSILLSGGGQSHFFPISLRGTGDESLAQVWPLFIDYGEELIGLTLSVPVTITNTHSATLFLAGGSVQAPFSAISGTPSCAGSVAPGASCQILYRFTPGQVAQADATASLGINDGINLAQNFTIRLRGRGRTSVGIISAWPVTFDFGPIKLGNRPELLTRYANHSSQDLTRGGGGIGQGEESFTGISGSEPNCASGAQPSGATCSARYVFHPRTRGTHTASTNMAFYGQGVTELVEHSMSGEGVGHLARVSPVEVDFGPIRVGHQVSVQVNLTNTSQFALSNLIGGGVTGAFSYTTTCGASLMPGSRCGFTYRLQPPSDGDYQAQTFLSYSNALGVQETREIILAGIGTSRVFANGFE